MTWSIFWINWKDKSQPGHLRNITANTRDTSQSLG